jgi:regulator of protease activity HflC (stomatin/prohibitin superfamily)
MLDKLLDFLLDLWDKAIPVFIVSEYQNALVLRLGKFKDVKTAGWWFKIPFLDEIIAVIKYNISDIKKFCLEIFDAIDAISDVTQAAIKNVVMDSNLEDCYSSELDNVITKKVRSEVRKYGINIHQVTLTTLGQIKSFRLIGSMPQE